MQTFTNEWNNRNDDQDNFMDEMDGTQKYYYNNHDFNDSSNASVYLNDAKDDDNSNNLSDASVYINDAKDYDNSNDSSDTNYDDNSNVSSDASDAEFDELQYLYMQQELIQEYDNYDTPLGDLYESDLSENINNSKFLIYIFNYKINSIINRILNWFRWIWVEYNRWLGMYIAALWN